MLKKQILICLLAIFALALPTFAAEIKLYPITYDIKVNLIEVDNSGYINVDGITYFELSDYNIKTLTSDIEGFRKLIINDDIRKVNDKEYLPLSYSNCRKYGIKLTFSKEEGLGLFLNSNSFKINSYYAISSYDQFTNFKNNGRFQTHDMISFGWARLGAEDDSLKLYSKSSSTNSFYIPRGHEDLIDSIKNYNLKKYFSIYAEDNYDVIFGDINKTSDMIVTSLSELKLTKLDAVTLDFEKMPSEYYAKYSELINMTSKKLQASGYKLAIASSPRDGFEYSDFIDNIEFIIFMAHDYDPKISTNTLTKNDVILGPLAPASRVEFDVSSLLKKVGSNNSEKIILQINSASSQWQVKNGEILNKYSYKPTYAMILQRIDKELAKGRDLTDVIRIDTDSKSPYIYYEDGDVKNFIWIESEKSVDQKANIALRYSLGGISIWRLGNIPSDNNHGIDIERSIDNLAKKIKN